MYSFSNTRTGSEASIRWAFTLIGSAEGYVGNLQPKIFETHLDSSQACLNFRVESASGGSGCRRTLCESTSMTYKLKSARSYVLTRPVEGERGRARDVAAHASGKNDVICAKNSKCSEEPTLLHKKSSTP